MSSRLGKQDANASFTILSIETVTEDELLVTYKVNCKLFNQKGKYLKYLKDAEEVV
ncbi:MAG: hypothetical protein ACOVQA_06675 [Thermoflexibacteraceae bacterium]|jgi:hypothetical protein